MGPSAEPRGTPVDRNNLDSRNTPILRPHEDEDSFPVLCDRELHSLHRNVPALRRRDVDTATIKQHYYPEGGWGWLVCGAAFLAHLLTSGLQLAFGLLYIYTIKFLVKRQQQQQQQDSSPAAATSTSLDGVSIHHDFYVMATAWMGALCLCVSFAASPIVVAVCRRKSTRLASVFGGLLLALACLFTSFAMQFHQAVLSYGVVLGAGAGIVRETSSLMLGHYFKRRREFVEMVAQAGTGVGVALFSVLYKEAVGKLGWRLGLQAVTGLLSLAFFLPIVYRSANLYHPQRRAITHLKNQRKKMKEKKTHAKVKKPPMFDFTPLKSRGLRVLILASSSAALGIYAPIFYLSFQGYREGLEDSALVLLQTFLGLASALGCVGFGLVTVKPSRQCLISRQYLCQAALVGIGLSLLALSAVQGYHGYVLFVWLYGVCLGGYNYSIKMYTLERIRARHYTKAWSFIQGARSIPVLIGVPIAGYINQTHPKAGYYFSFVASIVGACLLFLVGTRKDQQLQQQQQQRPPSPSALSAGGFLDECNCPLGAAAPPYHPHHLDHISYNYYRPVSVAGNHHYERLFATYEPSYDKGGGLHRHASSSFRHHRPDHSSRIHQQYLPKSLSYAANIECPPTTYYIHDYQQQQQQQQHPAYRNLLRPSKSVPEGLARTDYYYHHHHHRRPPAVRNVQVIEQITTSV
ncbi:PREDICTED: monocarboxylate transporter 2-like [Nicrophorus vespilloides]|uniref:Monocarboxylate transporter 2-like n=1 Tax=Nicrophorus vespilloides TaxID=110193 RepID=A0ABM1MKG0_NICVS|nr:PREDICTED: monocarboxylate transporter 2-like [Nicrophorus vespilloides]